MKKRLLAGIFFLASFLPLSAFDYGLNFNAGIDTSIINLYLYQNVTFKIQSEEKTGAEVGLRVLENASFSPHFYFNPFIQFDLSHWYVGGGLMLPSNMASSDDLLWFVRTGVLFGNWDMGSGKGDIDIGLELSPTIYIDEDAKDLGGALASIFGTIFNLVKLNVGFTWYLPLGGS